MSIKKGSMEEAILAVCKKHPDVGRRRRRQRSPPAALPMLLVLCPCIVAISAISVAAHVQHSFDARLHAPPPQQPATPLCCRPPRCRHSHPTRPPTSRTPP